MAVIDIDRHILTEIIAANNDLKKNYREYKKYWARIIEVRDKVDLLFSLSDKHDVKEELEQMKNKVYRATKKCESIMLCMQENYAKQAALLKHVVSEVREFHTGKGTESHIPDDPH